MDLMLKRLGAMVPTVIAIFAAWFAWQQVEVSRIHNRLSVQPILQITPYLEGKGKRNGLYLSNDGLGPAILKGFYVKSANVEAGGFSSDRWREIVQTTEANPLCFSTAWPKGETALKAGVESPLLILTSAEGFIAEQCQLEVVKLVGGPPIEIKVEYESIYHEPKTLIANSRINSRTLDELYRLITRK